MPALTPRFIPKVSISAVSTARPITKVCAIISARSIEEGHIGVVVAMGSATLELVLRWRDELWPGIPVVFAMVDEIDFAALKLPNDATGSILRTLLADSIKAARAVVPDLETVVLVGDHWDRQTIFRNWKP